ncbi:MAG TPA: TIGR03435 family protein [Bryobacteraceae bacterium]|jgi:uncharacterized protein (TIGR03435 family)|nr:TIGR03435 family protein [Bryobacteraceae bacterium]
MRTILGLTGTVLLCAISYAQSPAQPADAGPAFEVASVKAAPPPEPNRVFSPRSTGVPGQPGNQDPGRFTAEDYSIPNLITMAYGIEHYRLSAPPDLNRAIFNIQAKMPPDTTREQFRLMLQNLLAERFGLKVHWEARPMETYELVVAKGGPKLKDAAPDPPASAGEPARPPARRGPAQLDGNGFPVLPADWKGTIMMNGKAMMRAHNETAGQIAAKLAGQIGHPVTDATGLKGKYDYTLRWADSSGKVTADGPAAAQDDDAGPGIFAAIREQLGLQLESKKGQVQILVVDRVEKTPTEN